MKFKLLIIVFAFLFLVGNANSQTYYLGTGQASDVGIGSCAACHKDGGSATPTFNEWKETLHAVAQDSMTASYYGFDCLPCHNTGWDLAAANYGADEYVVRADGSTPNYTITDPTNWARVKNIGCESCHGPLGNSVRMLDNAHWGFGTTNKPDYSSENCGGCHNGEHHPYMEEWTASLHANSADLSYVVNNKACTKCHVAQNFVMFANDPGAYVDTVIVTGADIMPITCVTCHDPHSAENPGQLRFPLTGGTTVCDYCHQSGVESVNINSTPHHATSECLSGTVNFGYQYPGETYPNSTHTYVATQRCINCHVYMTPFGPDAAKTGHTFLPRVEACADAACHGENYYAEVDTSNHEEMFNLRDIQTETEGLMSTLEAKLENATSADSTTDAFKQARYNLLSVESEGSMGIHNTKLVQKLLTDAIARFDPTGVEAGEKLPTEFALEQNFPNPFNPATTISFSLPKASEVKLTVYDALGNVVEVLVNGSFGAGTFKVNFNAASYASGVYFYRIEAGQYNATMKMLLVK